MEAMATIIFTEQEIKEINNMRDLYSYEELEEYIKKKVLDRDLIISSVAKILKDKRNKIYENKEHINSIEELASDIYWKRQVATENVKDKKSIEALRLMYSMRELKELYIKGTVDEKDFLEEIEEIEEELKKI
jgi:hypothetical protein